MQRAKRLLVAIMICVLAAISVTLVACNGGDSHDYVWKFDESRHWKECSVQGCDAEEQDSAEHNLVDGVCECGYVQGKPAHVHSFIGAYVQFNATYHARKCANDNALNPVKEPHEYPEEGNEGGLDVNTCTRCGYVRRAATHTHQMVRVLEIKATCVERGVITHYECEECGLFFADREGKTELEEEDLYTEIDDTNHNVIVVESREPSCSAIGYATHKECTACHRYFEDKKATREVDRAGVDVAPTGHTITVQYHEYLDATCEEDGNIEYWTCDVCGENLADNSEAWDTEVYENVVIPAIGHDLFEHKRIEPTCEVPGNVEYWTCLNDCGKIFGDSAGNSEFDDMTATVLEPVEGAHPYSETWSANAEYHWFDALCSHGHHEEEDNDIEDSESSEEVEGEEDADGETEDPESETEDPESGSEDKSNGERVMGDADDVDGCETPHLIRGKETHTFPAAGVYTDPELAYKCTVCGYVQEYRTNFTYALAKDMDGEYNEYYGYEITGLDPSAEDMTEVVIPSVYRGLPVIRIADEAFKDNTEITRVTIPGSVMRIGKYAFDGCSNLAWVELNEGVRLIDERAFRNCKSLPGLILPDSMDGIGKFAFEGVWGGSYRGPESTGPTSAYLGWIVIGNYETWYGFPAGEKQMSKYNPAQEAIIQEGAFGNTVRIFLKDGAHKWTETATGENNILKANMVYATDSNPSFVSDSTNYYYEYRPLDPGEGNKENYWYYDNFGMPTNWSRWNNNGDQVE